MTPPKRKKRHFIWVSLYLARKYELHGDTYLYWRLDHHFTWSSEPREGPAICREKPVPSFLSHFKTLSIDPALGIEPTTSTSHSAVKRSIDWANHAAVKQQSFGRQIEELWFFKVLQQLVTNNINSLCKRIPLDAVFAEKE